MKFGVMYDFRNPRGAWWKPYPTLLREFLEQISMDRICTRSLKASVYSHW